jgi:parallel beta-helix repeat protein
VTAAYVLGTGNQSLTAGTTPYSFTNNVLVYFEPGTTSIDAGHRFSPGAATVYIGGYNRGAGRAVITGVNGNLGEGLTIGGADNETWEYLTVENYGSQQGGAVIGNSSGGDGAINNLTAEYDTIGPNEFGPYNGGAAPVAGQDSEGGYGLAGASSVVIEHDCLTRDAQGGFNIFGGANSSSGNGLPAIIVSGDIVSGNEISQDGLGEYPDLGCGCSGGGKFLWSHNAVFTNNYVRDNYGDAGVWFDFDNTGTQVQGNYISSNWEWGILYEASYNALITDNTITGNGWGDNTIVGTGGLWPSASCNDGNNCENGDGPNSGSYGNPSAGGLYLPDSGGTTLIPGSDYSGALTVSDNTITNNWDAVDLYQDSSRFSGGPYQCNGTLADQSTTYYQQWHQLGAADGVTSGVALTTKAGFVTFFQDGASGQTNYCGSPGILQTPTNTASTLYGVGLGIPVNDALASCSSAYACTLTTPASASPMLSSSLSSNGSISSLPVSATPYAVPAGTSITLSASGHTQSWYTTSSAPTGSTKVAVQSQTPNFAYPANTALGSEVYLSARGGCSEADLAGSSEGTASGSPSADYWDNCLFASRNVLVDNNAFGMTAGTVTGCTAANLCGLNVIVNSQSGFPGTEFDFYNKGAAYYADNAPVSGSPLNNVFSDNAYSWTSGPGTPTAWEFDIVAQGTGGVVAASVWDAARYNQDSGATGM